jgi:hypothetical protein
VTSRDRVSDFQEALWKVESEYGPVLPNSADQVAVARALANEAGLVVDRADVERAFDVAVGRQPRSAYLSAVVREIARAVPARTILDVLLDFRRYAIRSLSREFGGKTKGREKELRKHLETYMPEHAYTEAETGKGDTDFMLPEISTLIEGKIWYGREEYENGLEEVRSYIRTERPEAAYIVLFCDVDPLPPIVSGPDQAIADEPILSGLRVPVIVVPFEVDYPSQARRNKRKRAGSGG